MILILCALDDPEALGFASYCRRIGSDCCVLTGEALSFAAHRRQHLGDGIRANTMIELPGLPPITDPEPAGVLNRLVEPPYAAWRLADPAERDYAAAETYAFTLSWLSSLAGPVRNRPTPGCLAGPMPHPLQLVAAARRAGLDCPDLRLTTDAAGEPLDAAAARVAGPGAERASVVLLDGEVLTAGVPDRIAAGCRRLAAELDALEALVGIDFHRAGTRWMLAGLTPLPPLDAGRSLVSRRLVDLLSRPRAESAP